MHLCTHPDNKMARNSSTPVEEDSGDFVSLFVWFLGYVWIREAPGRRGSGSGRRRRKGARKEGEGELAEAVRTAAPAAAAVGAAGAEAGRDLCSSGIHGVNWLSGCGLLWEDDGGGSACQGGAKEDWERQRNSWGGKVRCFFFGKKIK